MSKLCEANSAIEILCDLGMDETEALSALDFAEDSGEFRQGRVSVVCHGRGVFEIEKR